MYDSERSRRAVLLGVGVTLAAVGLALAHLLSPDTAIDGTILALLGIAALPWLGSMFKSIELPGGVKAEYRQRLADVERKMADVEKAVIYGENDHALRRIGREVTNFSRHLEHIGLGVVTEAPKIDLQRAPEHYASAYDAETNVIGVDPRSANSPGMTLHEYAHVALMSSGFNFKSPRDTLGPIEAGLATYLTCSYLDSPRLGMITARAFSLGLVGYWLDGSSFAPDLPRRRRRPSRAWTSQRGTVWGQVLWRTRCAGEPHDVFGFDSAVASAWRSAAAIDGATEDAFTDSLSDELLRRGLNRHAGNFTKFATECRLTEAPRDSD
ncbi:hypothetical protein [Kitasatospora sp. LaBMicrA B282]|uniref:hypothetical protein n=1 Tax=Kitasatospora sp. LaBMicrA B282 TaxID=3420949 RepID=UPI003D0D19DF